MSKKTITIGGSVSGVIATGPYQNLKPQFTWQETLEDFQGDDDQIISRIKELYEKSMSLMREAETQATVERIQRERKDLRILRSPSGKMLPSVTSIINYDADFFVSPEELRQYAAQGTIIDARVKHYIRTGLWVEPKEIKEIWADLVIVARGNLKLEIDAGNFPAFLEKYPISNMQVGERFFNDELEYCGEPDFLGVPDGGEWNKLGAKPIPTIFDVKRTPDELKNGMQLAAYCRHYNIQQGIIVVLNDKTLQGYSKPVVYPYDRLEGFFAMFQSKQREFKKRYGI